MTPPAPSVTTIDILPSHGQSENRGATDAGLAAALDAITAGQSYYVGGMVNENGLVLGPPGAGALAIDRAVPATHFQPYAGGWRVTPAFTYQLLRAARLRGETADWGVILGDNGYGGRSIQTWNPVDVDPMGRNQIYWTQQAARLAGENDITFTMDRFFHFQGNADRDNLPGVYRSRWDTAFNALMDAAEPLGIANEPTLMLVALGGQVNTTGRNYYPVDDQYWLALDKGGIIGTWQRLYLSNDETGHFNADQVVLIGETCAWADEVVEGGGDWNITYGAAKSGAMVTVSFDLMPGETLMDRAGLYDDFGGNATCPHYGFEADGGIVSAVADLDGNSVTITLANPAAGWLKHAMQQQDMRPYPNGAGLRMSAHRSTLFGSVTRPSALIPGETLYRPVPGLWVLFNGDQVNRLDGTPFEGAP